MARRRAQLTNRVTPESTGSVLVLGPVLVLAFEPRPNPCYLSAVTWTRPIPWLLSLALAGCGAATGAPAAPVGDDDAGGRALPGDPVVVELNTDRAHVVRVEEAAAGGADHGTIVIASGVAGAMVVLDGEDPAPLPLSRELGAGAHEVIVSCPDASTETMTVSIEPGTTVNLRVCNASIQNP
jgi:hypothetical protein